MLSGCATFQGWLGETPQDNPSLPEPQATRYSDSPQMGVPSTRQYQRMTRSRMEEESELHSQAGSMWVNEGQTSYLFVQNKTRREGDILNIRLDGAALKQVETKVSVIKKLLQQLEDQQKADLQQRMASTEGTGDRAPAAETAAAKPAEKKAADDKQDLSDIEIVTTRITEKLQDGNYRIRGAQPFMIGKREYKVIVTGLIRPEDYDDQGISSTKILDPQFDVVSVRKKQGNENSNSL
ncbi:MAG: flagellar basal body L-ring protein FlgH [Bdellovibrionaceae bacterium]|nr:flagellar basal body L-ring protein FlgH [Pseudobdellovibrionaceae bacterium]